MSAEMLGTGVAFPVSFDTQRTIALAHGTQDVEEAIGIILATAPGERPMRPEFGCNIHRMIFERLSDATTARMERAIRAALQRWEPRIDVEEVSFDLGKADTGQLLIGIGYRLRATNSRRNLIYPFYLVPASEHA
ncbi:MAG TPA: GPW/gp25 family protein [Solirubrobacteraceae bacterium]|jgi:phage baseplate assembly protein W|nr:GPW/gp25 family protein [Solirubrobacteraceae bacterium]